MTVSVVTERFEMEENHETENLFDAYAVVGAVSPLEPTDETVEKWDDRAADLVDVGLIRDDEETPEGYVALRRTPAGASAAIPAEEGSEHEFYVCVKRRGKERRNEGRVRANAVTEIRVEASSKPSEHKSPRLRTKKASTGFGGLFGASRQRADPGGDEEGATWKTIESTPSGHRARLRLGKLKIRFARRADACRQPFLDMCVTAAGEKPPRGYVEEAVVVKHGGLLTTSSRICARRGALRGACDVTWRSAVLDRYPNAGEDPGGGFEWDVLPMLAWPHGLKLERAPASAPPPVRYIPYALTGDSRRPTFVSSIVFYEPLPPEERKRARFLAAEDDEEMESSTKKPTTLYAPKSVCVLTRCAGVAEGARRWLAALYTLALSALEMPLEHVVAHAVSRIPAPVRGGAPLSIRVNPSLPPIEIKLAREPPDAELPPLGASASIRSLFACFEPQDAVAAFSAALLERRLLLVSKRAALVSDVAEALRSLVFPLRWEGVYVPRLALPILDSLDFPGAILAGVDAGDRGGQRFAELAVAKARESGGYVILFLDVGAIEYCAGAAPVDLGGHNPRAIATTLFSKTPLLPESLATPLVRRWSKVANAAGLSPRDRDRAVAEQVFDNAPAPSALRFNKRRAHNKTFYDSSDDDPDDCGPPERAARDAALTTMVCVLDGYSDQLIVPHVDYYSVSSSRLFGEDEFVKSPRCAAATQQLRRRLVRTQSWARFIQRRVETSDADLVLFDECMQALRDASDAHRNAIIRGDALLLDSVDAAHHMRRLLAKSMDSIASPTGGEKKHVERSDSNGEASSERERRSERVSWHMRSSRWRDERLLKSAPARESECTYGSDARGRPRIEVPPPPPFMAQSDDHVVPQQKKGSPGKRYLYFVLGRGLRWPCPLDPKLLPPVPKSRELSRRRHSFHRKPRNSRVSSGDSTRMLARSQAELLLDMGLSVAGLRLGGGGNASQTNNGSSPPSSQRREDHHRIDRHDASRATAARQALHAFGAWFLFAPALVRLFSGYEQRDATDPSWSILTKGLGGAPSPMLVALGVLRRVLDAPCEPDEAIFRALLVAAGRSGNACKPIVADLFAQLRSKGIRPNVLTFGRYTQAIAQRDLRSQQLSIDSRNEDVLVDKEGNDSQPPLLEALGQDQLGGSDIADLIRVGLDHHRELRGCGDVVRVVARLPKPMGIIFEERHAPLRGVVIKSLNEDGAAARDKTALLLFRVAKKSLWIFLWRFLKLVTI
ncbi:hypothetical protein CTAYLR_004756 [Chrysophaeum taylorii]|uniref:UDENN domain-containing protein n=1 Tax=Chrysophaeum taylorii TaxID=2483200 RepID=A0AAD7U969_9STRA|nr:hypothetical protein CTAYLR_004756 [Chrysophaeum taylorii]